jgi:hypothetical protein
MANLAKLADVSAVLATGGFVRFTWRTGTAELRDSSGVVRPINGRTYQAPLKRKDLNRTEQGSTENANLIVDGAFGHLDRDQWRVSS